MKKFVLYVALAVFVAGCSDDGNYYPGGGGDDPVIPVTMVGIETINIDNSGEFPIASVSQIKKEAYMVGIRWTTNFSLNPNDVITGPIQLGQQTHSSLANRYSKRIIANSQFDEYISSGTNISSLFKAIEKNYLPDNIDEGFVLLVPPAPGVHSFRVEYLEGGSVKFFHITQPITFY
ncbi:MAG: hypothetical protein LBP96_00735 [Bacteroidales bacterium]|jgi:hypothetical protein|nr:hypothetical protein [Bacteroidales bacterium]